MKPWDRVRREVAGAWRSFRYDLDHRSTADVESKVETDAGPGAGRWTVGFGGSSAQIGFDGASAPTGFDRASTAIGFDGASAPIGFESPTIDFGTSTIDFGRRMPANPQGAAAGGYRAPRIRDGVWAQLRDPRRVVAALGVSSALAASAMAAFFAVSGGLGVQLVDAPGTPVTPSTAPASAPQVVTSTTTRPRQVPAQQRPSPSVAASVTPSGSAPAASPAGPSPSATVTPSPSAVPTSAPTPTASPAPKSTPSSTLSDIPSRNATVGAGQETAAAQPTP